MLDIVGVYVTLGIICDMLMISYFHMYFHPSIVTSVSKFPGESLIKLPLPMMNTSADNESNTDFN